MEIVVDLLMTAGGFDRGGLWRSDVGETLGPNGIGFPVGVRVLVVGESAFHDEGDALLELGHRCYGQFIECFDRYGDYLALGLTWGIVERENGCKGRKSRFLLDR